MAVTADFFEITPRNWRTRLAISVDVMRELSRYTDPEEMYHVFARRMSQLYPTSRQVSVSRRGLDRPAFRVTRFNLWAEPVNPYKEPHRLPLLAGGLLADLLYADEPRVIDDLVVSPDDPAARYLSGQRSLLAIPVFEDGVATTMIAVTREEPAAFPREQVPELVWMTNLFGRAMQTLVLSDRLREAYDAADYELRVIADLQRDLLPAAVPAVPGLEVAVHSQTAHREVGDGSPFGATHGSRAGGDYYDFFPLPGGKLGVLVADVSGHGTPAAVLMAITHSLAHSYPEPPESPGRFLGYLNRHLAQRYTTTTGHFVTAFYAVFDPAAGTMTYASAGHVPPRTTARTGAWRSASNYLGLPLGVNPHTAEYPDRTAPFGPGDKVAVVTDGVTDATDRLHDPFGFDRLDAALAAATGPPAEIVRQVVAALDSFTTGCPPTDDRTLVVVRWAGEPAA